MLKIFGTTQCRRCGGALEHTPSGPQAPIGSVLSRDSSLVCRACGFTRPVIYAYVRSNTPAA